MMNMNKKDFDYLMNEIEKRFEDYEISNIIVGKNNIDLELIKNDNKISIKIEETDPPMGSYPIDDHYRIRVIRKEIIKFEPSGEDKSWMEFKKKTDKLMGDKK